MSAEAPKTTKRVVLTPKQKALDINLDSSVYGAFSEIGAGQEVVRHFFRAGGASGTIALALSAYDKDVSDDLYGMEGSGRYVCKPRLETMLQNEYELLGQRLKEEHQADTCYFVYANTVATIDYRKTSKGHGWMGIRFQLRPDSEPNDIILHFRLHDLEQLPQQEAVGVVGVNLVFGAFRHHRDPKLLLKSLYDEVSRDRFELDMIHFSGPDFAGVDNRLMSLQLLKNDMTDAVLFGPDGYNQHPTEVLYKKNILTIRGSFRPVTKVNMDMIQNGYSEFIKDAKVDEDKIVELFEITMHNLRMEGDIDEQDFLDRADILCSLGQTVLISNFEQHYKLVEYLSLYSKKRMGLILGVDNLINIFEEQYYRSLNGGILEAFGILLTRDLKVYLYPSDHPEIDALYTSANVPIPPRVRALYGYLQSNGRVIDLDGFNPDVLKIYSREVLRMIKAGEPGWEEMVPDYVDSLIKEKNLFGYRDPLPAPDPEEEVEQPQHNKAASDSEKTAG